MASNFENYEPVPKEIKIGKKIRLLLIGFFLISTILVLLNASINFWLNVIEFGELFLRPIYFGFIGGIILVTISLFRLDFKNRRSIFWWFIQSIMDPTDADGTKREIPCHSGQVFAEMLRVDQIQKRLLRIQTA